MITPIILFVAFVASIYYIILPFLDDKLLAEPGQAADEFYTADELTKISLLKQIREVEFEKEMGITSDEDYTRVKNELMLETEKLMKSIEADSGKARSVKKVLNVCPSCSLPFHTGDKFCGNCGSSLKED